VPTKSLIAIIDDDEPFRTALVELLSSLGHDVRAFPSAEEFVAANAIGSYGCVITDIHMPGMSGLDLKRLLTARACGVPVVMITARTEPELDAKVSSCGGLCLLRKPFEAKTLIASLESALRA